MTSVLNKVNQMLFLAKKKVNELNSLYIGEEQKYESALLRSIYMQLTDAQGIILCYVEDIMHSRRERRKRYKKNVSDRKSVNFISNEMTNMNIK